MALSRTLWRSKFALDYLPPWTCPVCAKGTLNGSKATIKSIENSQSKSERHDEDWSPEWIRGSFYGLLKCTNCRESILMIGQMAVEEDVEYDEQTGGSSYSHAEFLSPIAFTPTIHIFPIHPHIPDIIKDAIVTSFKVYWADIESCGNKIRIVLELIMDSQKIPKTYLNAKGKKMGYSLHARIDHFKSRILKKQNCLWR